MATKADEEQSLPATLLVWFLEVLGAITAILFGTFGILSWQVAGEANKLASNANQFAEDANALTNTANMLALVALCGGSLSGTNVSLQHSSTPPVLEDNRLCPSSLAA